MSRYTRNKWRLKLQEIIYEADTPAGKLFDIVLLIVILASIILVMLESVKKIDQDYHNLLNISEWVITILFSIEYIARILTVKKPLKYVFSFYGVIDLLSTIPKYISLLFGGIHALAALRALRLLRVFRILKLARYLGASNNLLNAIKASRAKIAVFLFAVVIISIILGTIMYMIEGEENGFTNIPKSVYWCIVTLTTVGYGDISPQTPLGQFIAALVMILGFAILAFVAVPTAIVAVNYNNQNNSEKEEDPIQLNSQCCSNCLNESHRDDAEFCFKCGCKLHND